MISQGKKTVLISLSSLGSFKNLFFFPGSVFSILKTYLETHSDLRVVVVMPEREFKIKKFFQLHEGGYEKHFTVRGVAVKTPAGVIQRVFRFFYAYLIYTPTTMVLATMGTRPDQPPAGGRRFLAPLKWLIANTFGRSRFVKLKAVPKIFRLVFSERPFKEIFEKYRPDLVFSSHIYSWFDTALLAEAAGRGVKTMALPAGWDHMDKYFLPFRVDHLLVQSEAVGNAAVKFQNYLQDNLRIVGYPYFDYITGRAYATSRAAILQELGFPADAKYILYISGSTYCPDEPDVIREMVRWADQGFLGGKLYFVIRPYPGGSKRDKAYDENRFRALSELSRVVLVWQEIWADIERAGHFLNVMMHADIIMQVYTTAALEALALNRPIMSAPFDGWSKLPYHRSIRRFEGFEHFQEIIRSGALARAYNFAELKDWLSRLIQNPGLLKEPMERLKRTHCGPLDGQSSKRVAEAIINFVSS